MERVLNFEDVKNSGIEIFGNKFEMIFSEEYIEKLKSIKDKDIKESNVFDELKNILNVILNDEEAYDKIKKSYEEHEKKEFSLQIFMKVMMFIFTEYSKEITRIRGIDIGKQVNRPMMNREQRRATNYHKNNYNYNRKRNFRRY